MKIHLIGVGGTSMRGLAQYLVRAGHEVTGCDSLPVTIDEIPIELGHSPDHIDRSYDRVIYSSAITPSAPAWSELAAARGLRIETLRRAQAIGEITRHRQTITVSGAHGKSTTTGLIGHVLIALGQDPLLMLGAPLPELGGESDEWGRGRAFRWGEGPLVLEADEFDRSFQEFAPDLAVITNIDAEHLDYFKGGLVEIREAFSVFLAGAKPNAQVIFNADDPNTVRAITTAAHRRPDLRNVSYGAGKGQSYRLVTSRLEAGTSEISIQEQADSDCTDVTLAIPGRHNQMNALAAFSACRRLGLTAQRIASALVTFHGVGRRFDFLSERAGEKIFFDYGHHPREVAATIEAARAWYPHDRIRVIFQPHQYARTKLLFDDFVRALARADAVVITDIYNVAGREEQSAVSAADVASTIQTRTQTPATYVPAGGLVDWLGQHPQPGLTILMGAGRDIRLVGEQLSQHHA